MAKQKSLGESLVERLGKFAEDLKTTPDVATRYTVRTVRLNIPQQTFQAEDVKRLREQFGMSQVIFAKFLGASAKTLQDWEHGTKSPSPIACRLLHEMRAEPEYWKSRFAKMSEPVEA